MKARSYADNHGQNPLHFIKIFIKVTLFMFCIRKDSSNQNTLIFIPKKYEIKVQREKKVIIKYTTKKNSQIWNIYLLAFIACSTADCGTEVLNSLLFIGHHSCVPVVVFIQSPNCFHSIFELFVVSDGLLRLFYGCSIEFL